MVLIYKIIRKKVLNLTVALMEVEAPIVAKKAELGQFIILRTDENGERIPLTIADFDREKGTVTIIYTNLYMDKARVLSIRKWENMINFFIVMLI